MIVVSVQSVRIRGIYMYMYRKPILGKENIDIETRVPDL